MPSLTADASSSPAPPPPPSAFQAMNTGVVGSRLAVIIGWLGAKDRTLQKYADWYRASGWTPLVFTFPASSCLTLARATARRLACRDAILAVFDAATARAADGGAPPPAILMHSFSNTGWLAYCGLLGDLALARPAALAAIQGAVIDSAPFPAMSPEVWAAGFLTAAGSSKKDKKHQREGKRGGKAAGDAPSSTTTTAPDRSSMAFKATATFFSVWMQGARKRALKEVIRNEAAHANWPALYIFCEDDHVIPAASVRAAASEHAARGAGRWTARTVCFSTSEHVAHLRYHRAAYTSALDAFVSQDVLSHQAAAPAVASVPAPPARVAPLPPNNTALARSLSRSLSFKLDPSLTAAALARSSSIKAGPVTGNGGGGLGSGLAPIIIARGGALTHAGSIRASVGGAGEASGSPTAALAATLRSALPHLM